MNTIEKLFTGTNFIHWKYSARPFNKVPLNELLFLEQTEASS